jgi:prophage tail gpP-like protein
MSDAHGIVPRGPVPGASDVLTLIVDGAALSGWHRVTMWRSLDAVPASFDIQVTERYPTTAQVNIRAGQTCQVRIGSDLVLTGYVDRYAASLSPADHTVRIQGRSKSEDLVDCSAFFGDMSKPFGDPAGPSMQSFSGSALAIAQKLAAPYGVTVSSLAGPGAPIPQFNVNLGETAWQIIDRITRISQLVAYDLPDGSVVLAQAGSETMSSGFVQGQNIEQADIVYSMDARFSQYEGHMMASMALGTDAGVNSPGVGKIIRDDGVPRFRKLYVISEQTFMGQSLAEQRAQWECNRRIGRSQMLNLTTDSWRDAAGNLWAPNHLVPLDVPALKLTGAQWVIGSVTYLRDENGQHAVLVLMPPSAYQPEPIAVLPLPPLVQDVETFNATKPDPTPAP